MNNPCKVSLAKTTNPCKITAPKLTSPVTKK